MTLDHKDAAKSEIRWATAMIAVAGVMLALILWAGVGLHLNPPSNIETVDPSTLHLGGEFTEENLGTRVDSAGRVTAHILTAQFAFLPQCIVVPEKMQVTFRLASPDVIHGLIVVGTNVNTMVVPGFVSQIHTVFDRPGEYLMPCHEFCGLGHGEMMARVRVVPIAEFKPDADGRVRCAEG